MIEGSKTPRRPLACLRRLTPRSLLYVALALAMVGTMLAAIGSFMPAYTDPTAAELIRSGSECERGVPNKNIDLQCDSDTWYRSMSSLRTTKWTLVDLGAGLLASAMSVLIFAWWSGRKTWKQLTTPKWRLSILALVSVIWLAQIPAFGLFFITELARGYHPWWADSLAIPLAGTLSGVLALYLPCTAVWLFFVVGARLPAPVFSTVSGRPFVNVLWTAAAVAMFVPITLYLVTAVLSGVILMVPFLWLLLWLTLCARAAALSRHRPKLGEGLDAARVAK